MGAKRSRSRGPVARREAPTLRPRSILATVLALALVPLALPAAADASITIQPGSDVVIGSAGCTLNFVFADEDDALYVGTAGHCASGTGVRARTSPIGAWGTVVLDRDGPTDFALIRVDDDKRGLVRPDVRHWGGPTGVTASTETATGDALVFYGFGVGFGALEATRPRQGVLLGDSPSDFTSDMPAVNGDSGGPILHKATGKALGIVSEYNVPWSTDAGPTLEHIVQVVRASGFRVELVTAPYPGAVV